MSEGCSGSELPEVCNVRDVAAYLRVAENSVYAAIRTGELPAVRLGRRLLVSKTALLLWLDGDKPRVHTLGEG